MPNNGISKKNKSKIKPKIKPKTMENQSKKTEQENSYMVIYSDGKTIMDYIVAPNLKEAKKIASVNAKIKNYGTAYYKVSRCYNGGVRGSNNTTNWY